MELFHSHAPADDLSGSSSVCIWAGVEIRKLSLSVSSQISIFGLTSVQKIVLNQYKLSILALFTFKFLNFQWVDSTELKMISVSKLTKENKIYYNQVRMIGSSISFCIFVGYSEWKWVKIGPICIFFSRDSNLTTSVVCL